MGLNTWFPAGVATEKVVEFFRHGTSLGEVGRWRKALSFVAQPHFLSALCFLTADNMTSHLTLPLPHVSHRGALNSFLNPEPK